MAFRTSSRHSNSMKLSLDSWIFRSSPSAAEVDSMIISHDPNDCDTKVQRQENSRLMSLPVELLLSISEFLEPNDTASFTLTCKRAACAIGLKAWKHIGRGSRSKSKDTRWFRWRFLLALERDLSDYHLCHYSEMFLKMSHKNHSPHSSNFRADLDVCRRTNDYQKIEALWPFGRLASHLSFCDVQLIVNRSLYGNSHGYSLDSLTVLKPWATKLSWSCGNDIYLIKQDETPMMVKNELYIRTCSRRWALCSAEDIIRKKYQPQFFYDMPVCRHQMLNSHEQVIRNCIRNSIAIQGETDTESPGAFSTVSAPFGCTRCPIECRFAIFNHGPSKGIELALEVWRIMGSARSLHDPEWTTRGPPEWQPYSFDSPPVQPPPFHTLRNRTRSRLGVPPLGFQTLLFPEILNKPGTLLVKFSPNGIENAFDEEAWRMAIEQRKTRRENAREKGLKEQRQVSQVERSPWHRLKSRWSWRPLDLKYLKGYEESTLDLEPEGDGVEDGKP